MYDHQMNRISSRVTFGRDYSDTTAPDLITEVPGVSDDGALAEAFAEILGDALPEIDDVDLASIVDDATVELERRFAEADARIAARRAAQ